VTKFLYHRRSHASPGGVLTPPEPPESPDLGSASCGACGKDFPDAAALGRHQRLVHRLQRRHRC
ncbi:ZN574 protein, partial [Certhia brachydactyla]|nr:ZN574 protein [Certhia brachydactyla]